VIQKRQKLWPQSSVTGSVKKSRQMGQIVSWDKLWSRCLEAMFTPDHFLIPGSFSFEVTGQLDTPRIFQVPGYPNYCNNQQVIVIDEFMSS